jgi:hypothetical protein
MASATHFCNKYLNNSVSTKFLPPLDRVRPHLLCFLNIKFPGLQESVESKGKVFKLLDKKFSLKKMAFYSKISTALMFVSSFIELIFVNYSMHATYFQWHCQILTKMFNLLATVSIDFSAVICNCELRRMRYTIIY